MELERTGMGAGVEWQSEQAKIGVEAVGRALDGSNSWPQQAWMSPTAILEEGAGWYGNWSGRS